MSPTEGRFINFRPERPIEVALNILYGTDEIEYVVERVERSQDDDRISESTGEHRMRRRVVCRHGISCERDSEEVVSDEVYSATGTP